MSVEGFVAPEFEALRAEFEKNFAERGELGASLCVIVDGEVKADLWGGRADLDGESQWGEHTIVPVFSSTKNAVALSAHLLIDRGLLNPAAPVSEYWPGFAQAGKEAVTVQMLLNHQSGVPAFRAPVREGGFCDWDYMIKRLEDEPPFWEPGVRTGYHAFTIGWTVGELIRRISGMSLGEFVRRELVEPAGAEFHLGLQDSADPLVARVYPYMPQPGEALPELALTVLADPQSIPALALFSVGGWDANDPVCWKAEIGGAGGLSNGRGLARLFAPFSDEDAAPVSRDRIHAMEQVSAASQKDATLLAPVRFASGFMKSFDNRALGLGPGTSAILGHRAFGHAGAGGSIGFADPECKMAFGYAMNAMGPGIALNDRGQSLIDAAYQALGYRSDKSGCWRR